MKKLEVSMNLKSYSIYIERGCINSMNKYINLDRKVLLVCDSGVPTCWIDAVKKQCVNPYVFQFDQGEDSKSFDTYEKCLKYMVHNQFKRGDCVIAVGGGVVGDVAGFVASSYMRGIDFIQVPTTTLAQIDSSIGGKVAINVDQVKNCVGSFYQPKAVFVDLDTLSTLSRRQYNNGLVEAVKAGCLYDEEILQLFEKETLDIDEIVYRSLVFKKKIVEEDEYEQGIRKILNFGHTFGHGFESAYHLSDLFHGEAVAMGMLFMLEDEMKNRILHIFNKLNIPLKMDYPIDEVYHFINMDKKANHDSVKLVSLEEFQNPIIKEVSWKEIYNMLKENRL